MMLELQSMSSAKRHAVDEKSFRRSLMWSRNRQGPTREPWGTPDSTETNPEEAPCTTYCLPAVVREASDPGVDLASDPVVLEFVDKERVANLVEGLG